jgi:hypothetical protein
MHRCLVLLERLHPDSRPPSLQTFWILDRLRLQALAVVNELRPIELGPASLNLPIDGFRIRFAAIIERCGVAVLIRLHVLTQRSLHARFAARVEGRVQGDTAFV